MPFVATEMTNLLGLGFNLHYSFVRLDSLWFHKLIMKLIQYRLPLYAYRSRNFEVVQKVRLGSLEGKRGKGCLSFKGNKNDQASR